MKLFKLLFVTWFACTLILTGAKSAFASLLDSKEIEQFMDDLLQEKIKEFHIPNAAISIVSDGKVVFEKGYGYASFAEQKKVNPETTMFRVGSVSKLFTWTAVMQLVEQGKLDLNTDINKYLDFEIPPQLAVGKQRNVQPITLFHLMTHSPGFEDYVDTIFTLSVHNYLSLHEYIREHMPARVYPPGEVTAYSNYGTALAGYIVEQVSGMSFSEYVEKNIFNKLGMKHSTFLQPLPDEYADDFAHAYRFIDGEYRNGAFEFMPGPAGGLSTALSDMAKFMIAYFTRRKK